jgi:acetyl-CoA C-acetyltransferase
MTDAVIVSTARTAAHQELEGRLQHDPRRHAGGHAVSMPSARRHRPAEVEDVILGCANPEAPPAATSAPGRAAAGLPITWAGMSVNRFCSSGLQTIAMAAQRIIAGEGR